MYPLKRAVRKDAYLNVANLEVDILAVGNVKVDIFGNFEVYVLAIANLEVEI
jgi:hypothetical protein